MAPVNSTHSEAAVASPRLVQAEVPENTPEPVKEPKARKKNRSFIRKLETGTDLGYVQVGRSLGSGSFGRVYSGNVTVDDHRCDVAIKVCDTDPARAACLQQEVQMLKELMGVARVPMLFHYFRHQDLLVMVLNLLGPSLEDYRRQQGEKFSTRKVCDFARQLISALRHVHKRGIIHRDVKPANILLELDDVELQLCLADFGLARFYQQREHFPYRANRHFVGTQIYASVNAHSRISLSRRDDMESMFYTLMFLLVGPLPWQVEEQAQGGDGRVKLSHEDFVRCKSTQKIQELCAPFEPCWFELFLLCRNVEYAEEPDYNAMRLLMKSLDQGNDASWIEMSSASIPSYDFDLDSPGSNASMEELVPMERWEHKLSL